MKWLIYGKGWISDHFQQHLKELRPSDLLILGTARVDQTVELKKELLETSPDRVICLIGRTHGPGFSTIDYLQGDDKLKENIRDNLFSPIVLALICAELKLHLTYLGTGCIFSTENKETYTEEDEPNFFGSNYSIVKGFTDRLFHFLPNALNLRIRMPITSDKNPRNFITKITTYKKICSIANSMSVLPSLIPVMIQMSTDKITGTYNLCNPGTITHNRILELYREIVDHNFKWENFTLEEQNQLLKAGRSNNELDTSKLLQYSKVPNIETAVIEVLKNIKKL